DPRRRRCKGSFIMRNEKRFVLFLVLMLIWMMGFPYVARLLGIVPPPAKKAPIPPPAVAEADKKGEPDKAAGEAAKDSEKKKPQEPAKAEIVAEPKKPEVERVDPSELELGSEADKTAGGYRLAVHLNQEGAGITSLISSRYDAEYEDGVAVKRPLRLIRPDS